MMGVLPKRAVDDKVKIYKMRKGRVPPSARPVLEVLYSDLEKAREEGVDPDQAIEDMLIAKLGEECMDRFLCKVFDRTGQPVANIPPWEVDLGDGEDVDDEDDEDLGDFGDRGALMPPGYDPRGFPMQQMPPPAAQPLDVRAIADASRLGREEETKRSTDTMMMITTMMQQQAQQQQLAKQEAAERDERYRRETLEREERIRRENLEREEREKALRHENRQMMLGLVPIFLPVIQKVLGLDKQPGFDPGTQALIEVLKDRGNKSDPTDVVTNMIPKIMEMNTSMTQNSMASMMNMQAAVSKINMDSMFDTIKRLKDENGGKSEKSTMESIGEVLSVVGPMLAQGQQQAPVEAPALPAPAPQPPTPPRRRPPPPPPAQQAPAPAAPAASAAHPVPAAPVDRPLPRQAPSAAIRSCLHAIRKMSTGEHPAEHRFAVLHWVAQRLPQPLLQSLAAGNQDAVMQAGSGIVLADPVLLAWIQGNDNGAFLQEALNDLRVLITGKLSPEIAKVAIDQQLAFIRSHAKPPEPATTPAAAAPAVPTAVVEPAPAAVEPPAPAAPATTATPEAPAAGV
jgi:hypothetical protein